MYLILRYTIKYKNIKLLKHALRHTAVIFQTAAAGIFKYANTFFYTLYLINSPAATLRL